MGSVGFSSLTERVWGLEMWDMGIDCESFDVTFSLVPLAARSNRGREERNGCQD